MTPEAWTALGTIALAVVTVAVIFTTIIITVQDRRHAEARLKDEQDRTQKQEQLDGAYAVQVILGTLSGQTAGNADVKTVGRDSCQSCPVHGHPRGGTV